MGKSTVEVVAPPKSKLESARAQFATFFKEKVGKGWEDRADGKILPPKMDSDNKSLPIHEGWFSLESKRGYFSDFLSRTQPIEVRDGHYSSEIDSDNEDIPRNDQVENTMELKGSSYGGPELNTNSR
jgi:hypothetical protein